MSCSTSHWVNNEFQSIKLPDQRLTERFKKIMTLMLKNAQANIASTFKSWADTKACYRFIANPRVRMADLLLAHQAETLKRISEEETVLLIQDTTYLDYNTRRKTEGLDVTIRHPRAGDPVYGLMLHNTFALSTSGIPLGILSQEFIDRKEFHGKHRRQLRYWNSRIEDKESYRWVRTIQSHHKVSSMKQKVIHVTDREGDIYELYRDAVSLEAPFIVRASVNRSINKKKRREASTVKLFDLLESKCTQGNFTVNIQINGKKKFRRVRLSLRYEKITIPPPPNKTKNKDGDNLPNVPMWAILAIEPKPPKDQKAVKWLILTNLPIDTAEEAIEKITWYSYRWNIEIFHKILKSGCSVEQAQLRNADRLKKYITLKSIIAWRIFWLSRLLNKNKDSNCETVLSRQEWEILYRKIFKESPPNCPPTIKDVYYWIAILGGYLNRKSDPPPGIISIWRGWTRFMEVIEDYNDFYG